jgi:hypothetical protein
MFNNEQPLDEMITETQLKERVNLSRGTLKRLRDTGFLPYTQIPGGRRILYSWALVKIAFLRNGSNMPD